MRSWKTQILLDAIIEDLTKDSANTIQKLELLKKVSVNHMKVLI